MQLQPRIPENLHVDSIRLVIRNKRIVTNQLRRGILANGPGSSSTGARGGGDRLKNTTNNDKPPTEKRVKRAKPANKEAMELIAQGSTKTVECDTLLSTLTSNGVCPGCKHVRCS